MGIEYSAIKVPTKDSTIWKYMSFAQLVSMLQNKTLHFTRVDQLMDPFEGSFPSKNIENRSNYFEGKITRRKLKSLGDLYKEYIKHTFINCWHINKYQSDAMWKIYLPGGEGIAIKSTFGNLKNSFRKNQYKLKCGKIDYISYTKDSIPEGTETPYFYKRKTFEHEHELRFLFQDYSSNSTGEMQWSKSKNKAGINVKVNLNILIGKIVIAPECQAWHKKMVESLLRIYGINKSVSRSTLYTLDDRIQY